jgi:hypothetical protein
MTQPAMATCPSGTWSRTRECQAAEAALAAAEGRVACLVALTIAAAGLGVVVR